MNSMMSGKHYNSLMASSAIRYTDMFLQQSTGMHTSLCQCHTPNFIAQWHIIETVITFNPFERA